jgi:hypothetical protein
MKQLLTLILSSILVSQFNNCPLEIDAENRRITINNAIVKFPQLEQITYEKGKLNKKKTYFELTKNIRFESYEDQLYNRYSLQVSPFEEGEFPEKYYSQLWDSKPQVASYYVALNFVALVPKSNDAPDIPDIPNTHDIPSDVNVSSLKKVTHPVKPSYVKVSGGVKIKFQGLFTSHKVEIFTQADKDCAEGIINGLQTLNFQAPDSKESPQDKGDDIKELTKAKAAGFGIADRFRGNKTPKLENHDSQMHLLKSSPSRK